MRPDKKRFIDAIVTEAKTSMDDLVEHIKLMGDDVSKANVQYIVQSAELLQKFLDVTNEHYK